MRSAQDLLGERAMDRRTALALAAIASVVLVAILVLTVGSPAPSTPSPSPTAAAAVISPTATPGASPTATASPVARRYASPLGYSVSLTPPWRRSDLQSRLEPDPRGDPDLLAVERFTILSPADERDAIARTHVGFGPAYSYTAWVSLYRNSRGLSATAYAEREKSALGLNAVSVEPATLDGRAGARTTWRYASDPRTFYAYYVPERDRMWIVGFFLGPMDQRPAGATDEAVRAIVESFRFGGG